MPTAIKSRLRPRVAVGQPYGEQMPTPEPDMSQMVSGIKDLDKVARYLNMDKVQTLAEETYRKEHGLQTITGPHTLVNDATGEEVAEFGEGGQDETLSINPVGDRALRSMGKPGVRGYQTGGQILIDPNRDPNDYYTDENNVTHLRSAQPAPVASPQPGPAAGILSQRQNILTAQEAQYGAQEADLAANRRVAQAQAGTIAPQRAQIASTRQVIDAGDAYNAGNRGLTVQQQQANAQRVEAEKQIQVASKDVGDQTAVARVIAHRADTDYLFDLAGVSRPQEIDTPTGADTAGLPPGVRAKIKTRAALLTENEADTEKLRGLKLEGARLAVSLLGNDVQAAQNAAQRVGLSLDEAQLLVDEAQQGARESGFNVTEKGIGVNRAQGALERLRLPPSAGQVVYENPFTGESEWLSPAEATKKQAAEPTLWTDPATGVGEYVSRAEADRREADYRFQSGLDRGIAQAPAKRAAERQVAAGEYAESDLAGYSEDELLGLVSKQMADGFAVIDELQRRFGYSRQQAETKVAEAYTRGRPSSGGGVTINPETGELE